MKMNLESVLDSRKREDRLPMKSIALSFAIHIGCLAAIYFGTRIFENQGNFSPFISASLVPAKGLPSFSQAAPSKKVEEPVVQKEPEQEKSTEEAVKLPTLEATKKTREKTKEDTSKKDKSASKEISSSSGNSGTGKPGERYGLPTGSEEGYGAESGSISSMTVDDFEYTWYSASVAGILSKNWVRSIAPPELKGTSVIARFRIYDDGRIDDVFLVKKCGIFALDQEVIRAVQNASPLPPLPKGFQKKSLVAQYEFVY